MRFTKILPAFLPLLLAGCASDAASVGIIGGADGPTAIFTTSQIAPHVWIGGAVILAIAAAVVLVLLRRRRK